MKKRSFLKALGLTVLGTSSSSVMGNAFPEKMNVPGSTKENTPQIISTSTNGKETKIWVKSQKESCVMMHITDSHITIPSDGDKEVWNYCKRMHQAYLNTSSHVSGENVSRAEAFRMLVDVAKRKQVDLLVMSGDILNFPSPSTVNFVHKTLEESGVPYVYVAGNHDWHLEGTPGSDKEKRLKYIPVLQSLYQGKNPLYNSTVVKGINVVCIDNSTYQINKEQLDFFKQQLKRGLPIVLVMHIPVCTSQNTDSTMGYKKWGAGIDTIYKLEGREQWSAAGNRPETVEFHKLLMNTPDIIVLCGHVHTERVEHEKELQQYVTSLSRDGAYRILDFESPDKERNF